MNDSSNVAVLVPAAGSGKRMGGTRKQFRLLGGAPILRRTLDIFESHPLVGSIVVAVPPSDVADLAAALRRNGIHKLSDVVPGGDSRQASVAAALAAVPDPVEIVLVHDAVRPFLSGERVTALIEAVREYGAAALAVAVTDTLRLGADHYFERTIPRSGLYRMQTPQGFRRDWFDDAHRSARQGEYRETDDVALVQRTGREVRVVDGSSTNIKITTDADWELAQALWQSIHVDESR